MDGKVANQRPRTKWWILNVVPVEANCGNCSKLISAPISTEVKGFEQQVFQAYSYLGSDYFIYDTKSGKSVCYCSDYCRKQHNHRFRD